MSETSVRLPTDLNLDLNSDNSVSLRWTFPTREAAVDGFEALKTMAETGELSINMVGLSQRLVTKKLAD